MKKLSLKIVSVILAMIISVCAVIAVNAQSADNTSKVNNTQESKSVKDNNKPTKISKDETVYVLAGADGSVKKVIVSDWIKNAISEGKISDKTNLKNVKNVKGNEKYTLDSNNMTVWDAQGNDVYYSGNIDEELPVNLSVSYKLDGKNITADKLAGKNGKVTIRFDYENKQYETVNIDGKSEKIYVPFVMLTGMLFNNDTFRNVEVTNGKVINDGDRTAVIGIALPGLQKNLNITSDKLEIPDFVEITADVENFKMGMSITLATNELFSNFDTSKLNDLDNVANSVNDLTGGMNQLLDGSSALYNGLDLLLSKSNELVSGIKELANGSKTLKEGTEKIDFGAGNIKSGAFELYGGLNELSSNNPQLNGGAKQVFETMLSTAQSQLNNAGITTPTLTIENYSAVLTAVLSQVSNIPTAAASVTTLKASLDSYNQFYTGLLNYTGGVEKATNGSKELYLGANQLKAGTEELKLGSEKLYNGVLKLQDGTSVLVGGVSELKNGAVKLSGGLKKLNDEGVSKIIKLVNGDIKGLATRIKATADVSKNYKNFSGISDDMDGQVKFIYRTDEIKVK